MWCVLRAVCLSVQNKVLKQRSVSYPLLHIHITQPEIEHLVSEVGFVSQTVDVIKQCSVATYVSGGITLQKKNFWNNQLSTP